MIIFSCIITTEVQGYVMLIESEMKHRIAVCQNFFGDEWTEGMLTRFPSLWTEAQIQETCDELTRCGFKDPVAFCKKVPGLLCGCFVDVDAHIKGLRERGFTDVVTLYLNNPKLLCYSLSDIDRKLKALRELGFEKPEKHSKKPHMLRWRISLLDTKIQNLRDLGFQNPHLLLYKYYGVFSQSVVRIRSSLTALRELGFTDPVRLCTMMPIILCYTTDNISKKIENLKDCGCEDPISMCTKLPGLLTLSVHNIQRKVRLARRLGADIPEFLKHYIAFCTMSHKHYIPLIRACREHGVAPTASNVRIIYQKRPL